LMSVGLSHAARRDRDPAAIPASEMASVSGLVALQT
jgi:hypothetical protein